MSYDPLIYLSPWNHQYYIMHELIDRHAQSQLPKIIEATHL